MCSFPLLDGLNINLDSIQIMSSLYLTIAINKIYGPDLLPYFIFLTGASDVSLGLFLELMLICLRHPSAAVRGLQIN